MSKNNSILHQVLLLATLVIVLAAAPVKSERPVYYGISPAFPKSAEIPPFDLPIPFISRQRTIPLTLEIDQTGSVKNAVPQSAADSSFAKYVLSSLAKMSFEPAQINGTKASSNLPILVTINPRFRTTTIDFPIDAKTMIESGVLYFRALELCGVVLPEITKFPAYFCEIKSRDSIQYLPFVLLSLELDGTGQVRTTEVVNTNLPAFSTQTQSAALWADISPLKLNGQGTPSRCFLLLSFFPQLQYPSAQIDFLKDTVYEWYDRWRVQLFSDTVGLMLPPLSRGTEMGEINLASKDSHLWGEVVADLSIDTLGYLKLNSIDSRNHPIHQAIMAALKNVRFYPALNFSGQAVTFEGVAKFSFRGRTTVRTEYLWLKTD